MFFLYSILLSLGFLILLPRFVFDAIFNGKYAAGFGQRLGFLPAFSPEGHKVVWLHCVSVGEVNAARPLVAALAAEFPRTRLIVSTTTRTGQELALDAFKEAANLVFYFPFDWRFAVRRALRRMQPSVVLLMETEIWFRFIREASKSGARLAIVNGRLSERSYKRFGYIKQFMRRVLGYVDLALMQGNGDAKRLMALGIRASKVRVTGNLKFDQPIGEHPTLTHELRARFGISQDAPLIIAASTHAPEEKIILEAFNSLWKRAGDRLPRLMIAPRHPERFSAAADEIRRSGFDWVRRSEAASTRDETAEVILLDTIGELRAAYPLAEIVFVGGSLIPHGGQSVLEPAAAGRAIITGPHTANFDEAVHEFLSHAGLSQLPKSRDDEYAARLADEFTSLLDDPERRRELGQNALAVAERNCGATAKTVEFLKHLIPADAAK